MIPTEHIEAWRAQAPWTTEAMVEQDLVLSRALVEIFSNQTIKNAMAFRGGTALHKLYLSPLRYSEDIDLVQVRAEPAGPFMSALHDTLSPWLGRPTYKQTQGRITYKFRLQTAAGRPMRLKVEVNTREHLALDGIRERPLAMESSWFSGSCAIPTYSLNELMGSKFRALYQRKKGRDLFDVANGLAHKEANPARIVEIFQIYREQDATRVTQRQFTANLAAKLADAAFHDDLAPLPAAGLAVDLPAMSALVETTLFPLLPE